VTFVGAGGGKRGRQSGFTLIEMMAVILVVLVTAALAAPAITTSLGEQRAQRAALDIVRVGRLARSEALEFGRAYLVRMDTTGAGSVRAFRGVASACNAATNDWPAFITAGLGAGCRPGSYCVTEVDFADDRYRIGPHAPVMTLPVSPVEVCYQPNGATLARAGAGATLPFSDRNTVAGGWIATITRHRDGVADGPVRRVVYPFGATPRMLR
jgi:prepilin-type N-terminal cleavage/methylation domain-containing protein